MQFAGIPTPRFLGRAQQQPWSHTSKARWLQTSKGGPMVPLRRPQLSGSLGQKVWNPWMLSCGLLTVGMYMAVYGSVWYGIRPYIKNKWKRIVYVRIQRSFLPDSTFFFVSFSLIQCVLDCMWVGAVAVNGSLELLLLASYYSHTEMLARDVYVRECCLRLLHSASTENTMRWQVLGFHWYPRLLLATRFNTDMIGHESLQHLVVDLIKETSIPSMSTYVGLRCLDCLSTQSWCWMFGPNPEPAFSDSAFASCAS